MFHQIGHNDIVLLPSLLFFCADIWIGWDTFGACSKPIQAWLFVSIVCAVMFRLMRLLAFGAVRRASGESAGRVRSIGGSLGEVLFDLRHQGCVPQVLTFFAWAVAAPFFTVWNFMGAFWLWDVLHTTPQCMPSDTYSWFSILWLGLCGYWLLVHTALGMKAMWLRSKVLRTEANLLAIGMDSEVQERWGRMAQSNESVVDAASATSGLTPDEIKCLPCDSWSLQGAECECPVCMADFQTGDSIRCLPRCGHTFHRACIDLWLVRRADCPLCKQQIAVGQSFEC